MSLFSNENLADNTQVNGMKIQNVAHLVVPLAAASTNATIFNATVPYRVVSATTIFGTAGGSGATVNLEVIPTGTANGSGTATVLSAAQALTGTTNTPVKAVLGAGTLIPAGSRLGTVLAGTLTGLANGVIQLALARV